MTALVIAEHDNASIKGATLNTVTAAAACGGEVHVLVAGHNAGTAAQAAAQIAGVSKVIHADSASLAHSLAENVAAQVLAIAEMCLLAGKSEMTAALIERGVSVDQARKELLAAKASGSPEISSRILPEAGTQTQAKPEDSPVVRAAQQRAQKQRDAAQVTHR